MRFEKGVLDLVFKRVWKIAESSIWEVKRWKQVCLQSLIRVVFENSLETYLQQAGVPFVFHLLLSDTKINRNLTYDEGSLAVGIFPTYSLPLLLQRKIPIPSWWEDRSASSRQVQLRHLRTINYGASGRLYSLTRFRTPRGPAAIPAIPSPLILLPNDYWWWSVKISDEKIVFENFRVQLSLDSWVKSTRAKRVIHPPSSSHPCPGFNNFDWAFFSLFTVT